MFKVLIIKTTERRQWRHTYFIPFSSIFIVDFEQVNVNWVNFINSSVCILWATKFSSVDVQSYEDKYY